VEQKSLNPPLRQKKEVTTVTINPHKLTLEDFYGPKPNKETPQNPTPKQLSIQERRNKVIALILQRVAVTEIARQLKVDRSTIYADFEEWVKTEQANHLLIEWLQQYEQMKQDNPAEAFTALTKLVMKILEKQAKLEVNVSQQNNISNSFVVRIVDNSKQPNPAAGTDSRVPHAPGTA